MKKSVLWGIIALATATMSSCSNDEPVEALQQNNAIEFGTYLGRDAQGRGVVLDGSNLAKFGVFAFYTGKTLWKDYKGNSSAYPNFMYNQVVEKDGTGWKYSPKKYWPTTKGDQITFFAYAPHKKDTNYTGIDVSGEDATNTPTITYSITAANLETQADFVADALIDKIRTTGGDGTSLDNYDETSIKFTLQHELTRLGFTASLSHDAWDDTKDNKTKVNIKSITFVAADEFATEAVYTFANENDIESPKTIIRGTWSNWTNKVGALSLATLLDTKTPSDFGGYITPGVLVSGTRPNHDVTLFKKNTDTKQHYLYLIPRGKDGISADGKVKINVEYDIVTVDGSLKEGHSVTSATKIIEFPAGTLKQGVAYNFHLTFGLNEVVMAATVAEWDDPEEFGGNVDWPKDDVTNP